MRKKVKFTATQKGGNVSNDSISVTLMLSSTDADILSVSDPNAWVMEQIESHMWHVPSAFSRWQYYKIRTFCLDAMRAYLCQYNLVVTL